jgi:exopolysaccharide production protein ExoQ
MSFLDRPRFRAVYLTLVLFTLFAGDVWRYSITWWGFSAIAIAMTVIAVIMLVRSKKRGAWAWNMMPFFLALFLLLVTASIAWSFYPGASALGVLTTWMSLAVAVSIAVNYSWREILRAMGLAFRLILGLSLVFEFVVSAFIGKPILPFWVDYDTTEKLPKLLYWSRDLLFEGGKIQGIVGNSSLLAFVALVGLIVFCIQFAAKSTNRVRTAFWIAIAVVNIALTRSATITVALVVLAFVVIVVLALRRVGPRGALAIYAAVVALVVGGVIAVTQLSSSILGLLGKSDDLTGRLDIWNAVITLAQQRPAFGWGWVSYWVPWVAPFDTLAFVAGVRQLHAHNAWLDVFLQLGIVGLVVFGLLVLSTGIRSWQLATQTERVSPDSPGRFTTISLLPLLLLVALLVQSLAESRLLVEYGIVTLVIITVKTKLHERPVVT